MSQLLLAVYPEYLVQFILFSIRFFLVAVILFAVLVIWPFFTIIQSIYYWIDGGHVEPQRKKTKKFQQLKNICIEWTVVCIMITPPSFSTKLIFFLHFYSFSKCLESFNYFCSYKNSSDMSYHNDIFMKYEKNSFF